MGSITPTFVHAIAESLQFHTLSKDAAEGLAPHLEVRLREIIQDALKFMRRSKRHTLSPDDINGALIAKSREVSSLCTTQAHPEGFQFTACSPFLEPSEPSPGSEV